VEILWKVLWNNVQRIGRKTITGADAPVSRVLAPDDPCGIPVEDMWIFRNPRVIDKQFQIFFYGGDEASSLYA
jgi:hypothetical protein